jgi:hypothetical protein
VPGRQDDLHQMRPPDQAVTADAPPRWSRAELQQRLLRLPPGHPSSPFNGDGSRKPPPPDLKKLELPFPDEEAGGSAWTQAAAALRAKWHDHKERWPAEAREPADKSGDEPGSWRGDGGQFLNAEENLVAGHAHERVAAAEPDVTASQREVRSEVPGADLVGLEYRLKGEDRFKEKVAEDARAMPERPIREIADQIPDAVRYTFQFDRDRYVDGYWQVRERLQNQGHDLVLSRNSWDSSQYKGINTRWRTEGGQLFEVQIHTPESFEAKQLTHGAYERIRSPGTSKAERDELYEFQAEVAAKIPRPDRVTEIPNYREGQP